jgi:hypothetical protein
MSMLGCEFIWRWTGVKTSPKENATLITLVTNHRPKNACIRRNDKLGHPSLSGLKSLHPGPGSPLRFEVLPCYVNAQDSWLSIHHVYREAPLMYCSISEYRGKAQWRHAVVQYLQRRVWP